MKTKPPITGSRRQAGVSLIELMISLLLSLLLIAGMAYLVMLEGYSERTSAEYNERSLTERLEILSALGYVDMKRVAAFGISNGGFVTTATVATYPSAFLVAAHAAAGVQDPDTGEPPSGPSPSLAAGVRTPYSLHHGDPDSTNPLSSDQRFASICAGLCGAGTATVRVRPGNRNGHQNTLSLSEKWAPTTSPSSPLGRYVCGATPCSSSGS